MSIFTALALFLANLFTSIKKEYNNLEPLVRTYIEGAIKCINLVKNNLTQPSTAIWALIDAELGTTLSQAIAAILGLVLVDLNIIDVSAVTPAEPLQMLIDYLSKFSGFKLLDELFNAAKYIAMRLVGSELTRSKANILVQYAYDANFSAPVVPLTVQGPPLQEAA